MPAPAARPLLTLLVPCALGAAAAGQSATPLVVEGDVVSGVGAVTSIQNLAVNSSGSWIVEVDTDNPDTNVDSALIQGGALLLQEGQALAAPSGATIDTFDAVTLNANGDSAWNLFLDGTSGSSDDSGIFFNGTLVIQESDVSTATGFSVGTPYIGFFETKFNAAGQILVMASVDDPAIGSSVDRALVIAAVDGTGNLLSETVLYKEGDVLPGQVDALADFGTGPHAFDLNEAGSVLYIADLGGPTTTDGCIYLDGALLAQEGGPSPLPGRNWLSLSTSNRVALGDGGDYVFTGSLDGSTADNSVIVLNGAVFRQEGESLPAFAPHLLTSFGSGPVDVDDAGNVLWYGDWDDPDTTRDTGLLLNDTLLVQEGVTVINGQVVDSLRGVQDGYALSPDGGYVVFEATLANGLEGAFLIDLSGCPPPVTYCTASSTSIPGCAASISSTGSPALSDPTAFQLRSGNVPGSTIGLAYFSQNGRASIPFGTQGGLLCVQFPGYRSGGKPSGGNLGVCNGQYVFTLQDLIDKGSVIFTVGNTINAAMWFRDPANADGFALSDGIEFTLCP
jgi:hypothetical protein